MSCTQKQQLVCFPKVRVYKPWFRHFNDHKDFRNEGTVHLFSLMALFSYARTVIRSKNMLQIIKNALNTVRLDPDHGELMYQILYLTYFSERKLANREAILAELERIGFQMSMVTYHSYLNMAIKAIDRILWGYTARDCMEIIKQFLP